MTVCLCTKCGRIDDVQYGEGAVMGIIAVGCNCGGDFLPTTADYVYQKYERVKDELFRLRLEMTDVTGAKCDLCDCIMDGLDTPVCVDCWNKEQADLSALQHQHEALRREVGMCVDRIRAEAAMVDYMTRDNETKNIVDACERLEALLADGEIM